MIKTHLFTRSSLTRHHVLTLALITLFQISCSGPKEATDVAYISEDIPLKGNPLTFLKNTKRNTEEGLPAELFESDDQRWHFKLSVYHTEEAVNKEGRIKEGQESVSLEDIERAEEEAESEDVSHVEVRSYIDDKNLSLFFDDQGSYETILNFKRADNDTYKVTAENIENHSYTNTVYEILNADNFKVEHYSVKDDLSAFSVLTSFENKQNDSGYLYNYTFYKIPKDLKTFSLSQLVDLTAKAYNYMLGPGIKVRWDRSKTLKFDICQSGSIDKYTEAIHSSFLEWKTVLEDRLHVKLSEAPVVCPPFNDLNSHTITHVTDWQEAYGRAYNPAFVTHQINIPAQEIIDADMVILEKEIDRIYTSSLDASFTMSSPKLYKDPSFQDFYSEFVLHEWGHMFGLHHKFDGTASIMSYNDSRLNRLRDYDTQAIQALYPKLHPDLYGP